MAVAVVTGAASGFGLALSERCAGTGMDVALLDLDGGRATAEAERLRDAYGTSVVAVAVDVADGGSVNAAAAAVSEQFDTVDLVVSNVDVQLFGAVGVARADPFVVLVWVDNEYGLIRWKMDLELGHSTDTAFGNPDFVAYAESFGARGYRIEAAEELLPTLRRALADDTVSVIDCPVDSSANMELTNTLGDLDEPMS